MTIYGEILKHTHKSGKLIHYACKPSWYEINNLDNILTAIYSSTSFLPLDRSLRERLFYIENNYTEAVLCTYCNIRPLKTKQGNCFRSSCCEKDCISKQKTQLGYKKAIALKNNTEKYNKKIEKLKQANKGKTISEDQKNKLRIANLGKKQSTDTIQKRVESRKGYRHSDDVKEKIRQSNKETSKRKGPRNVTEEYRLACSQRLKQKIQDGEFTPCITNTWTHWNDSIFINEVEYKFRSSWEMAFWLCNQNLEYESVRIPYVNDKNKTAIYIVDFLDKFSKVLYEIKPTTKVEEKNTILKTKAAQIWCKNNGYEYRIITENDIKKLNIPAEYQNHSFYRKIQKLKK